MATYRATRKRPLLTRLVRQILRLTGCASVVGLLLWSHAPLAEAQTSVRVLPSGDRLELVNDAPDGGYRMTLPLYRSGDVRYFCAGVGLEERQADYPPFPLKIILVAEGGAYLTHVAVTIRDESGALSIDIPKERVTGPWVFVDLPPGIYNLSAVRDGDTRERTHFKILPNSTRTLYFRWP